MGCFPWKAAQCSGMGAGQWHGGVWPSDHLCAPALLLAAPRQHCAPRPSHVPNGRPSTNRIALSHLCTLFIIRVWNLDAACELRGHNFLPYLLHYWSKYVWNQMARPVARQVMASFAQKLGSVHLFSLSTPFTYLYQTTLLFWDKLVFFWAILQILWAKFRLGIRGKRYFWCPWKLYTLTQGLA